MNRGTGRRRLRLRRKRKNETFGSKLSDSGQAKGVAESSDTAGSIAAEIGTEVVFRVGCCLLESVVSATVLVALISVPAYLLLHRVT